MKSKIDIELNRWEFWGGDTVAGTVVLYLNRPTPIRGIRLRLYGYESASWSSGKSSFEENRVLVEEQQTLHGQAALGAARLVTDSIQGFFIKGKYEELPAGEYRYRFAVKLPPNLPGAFRSDLTRSKVWYSLEVQADLPLKLDLKAERWLDVREPQPAETPRTVRAQGSGHSLLGQETLAELAVQLYKDAYRADQEVCCRLQVTNHSPSKKLRRIRVVLYQIENATAKEHSSNERKALAKAEFPTTDWRFKETRTGELKLKLPAELIPTTTLTKLVKVSYELEATLDIPWARDVILTLPFKVIAKRKLLPKAKWRRRLADAFGPKAAKGILEGLPAAEFNKAMGPPDDIDTTSATPFWYYDCSDGMLQLELDGTLLDQAGLLRGKINQE